MADTERIMMVMLYRGFTIRYSRAIQPVIALNALSASVKSTAPRSRARAIAGSALAADGGELKQRLDSRAAHAPFLIVLDGRDEHAHTIARAVTQSPDSHRGAPSSFGIGIADVCGERRHDGGLGVPGRESPGSRRRRTLQSGRER